MSSNNGNVGNDNNLADILQLIGQWFNVTEDTLGLIGQGYGIRTR